MPFMTPPAIPPEPTFRTTKQREQFLDYVSAVVTEAKIDVQNLATIRRAKALVAAHENALKFARRTLSLAAEARCLRITDRAAAEIQRLEREIEEIRRQTGLRP